MEIAKTGLFISQKGLDVTGHNIANVDTAGYTRQRLALTAIDPYNADFKMRPLVRGLVGGGVQVQLLEQIRDAFLDRQFRTEQADYSRWATRTTGLEYLEPLFDDGRASGITANIVRLFNAFDDLVHSSSDLEQRTIMRQAALTMMASMQTTYNSMITQHTVHNESIKAMADEINSIADSIAILNGAISRFERDGDGMQKANDLRDKRNLLLDQLSALVDIDYFENSQGQLTVKTCGEVLVYHTEANSITYTTIASPAVAGQDIWQLTLGATILDMNKVGGGELKGHLELRDNDQLENAGIPYFINQLNALARALVVEINAIHRQGYTHPNSGSPSQQGVDFFYVPPGGLNDITAGNLRLSDKVSESVWNIACSDEPIDLSDPLNAKAGNQNIAKLLAALIDSTSLPNAAATGVTTFNGFILSMLAEYASLANHSKTLTQTLGYNVLNIENSRISISGVSLDEEMTNLMKYQHAYNGAARVITAFDEALDMLINRMGIVGRS